MSQPDATLRIGDAERESAATALGEHFAAGRLTRDEFDERPEQAWNARPGAEITFLTQEGQWRIWKFRLVEVARTPFEENWSRSPMPTTRRSSETLRTSARIARRSTCPNPASRP